MCTSISIRSNLGCSFAFPMQPMQLCIENELMMGWFAPLAFHRRGGHHCMWPNTAIFPELENQLGQACMQQCLASLCLSSIHAHTRTTEWEREGRILVRRSNRRSVAS
jgi:hypothetical protein